METSDRIALGDEYYEREGTIANYVLMVAIPWGAMRRAGIDPASPRGDLLTGLWKFTAYLVLPLVVALVSGTVDDAPLLAWVVVAAVFGYGGWSAPRDIRKVTAQLTSLARCMSDVDGLRALVRFSRRWYSLRFVVPASLAFVAVVTAFLPVWRAGGEGADVTPGSVAVLLLLLYDVGEIVSTSILQLYEFRLLRDRRFELQTVSPFETPCVQETIRGANSAALDGALMATWYLVATLILLPHDATAVLPIAAAIFTASYLSIFVTIAYVRRVVAGIVVEEKARRLAELGGRIDALLSRVPDLSPGEERQLDQLRKARDLVAEAPTARPVWGTVGRFVATVLIPTLSFVAAAAAEGYIERVLNQVLDALP